MMSQQAYESHVNIHEEICELNSFSDSHESTHFFFTGQDSELTTAFLNLEAKDKEIENLIQQTDAENSLTGLNISDANKKCEDRSTSEKNRTNRRLTKIFKYLALAAVPAAAVLALVSFGYSQSTLHSHTEHPATRNEINFEIIRGTDFSNNVQSGLRLKVARENASRGKKSNKASLKMLGAGKRLAGEKTKEVNETILERMLENSDANVSKKEVHSRGNMSRYTLFGKSKVQKAEDLLTNEAIEEHVIVYKKNKFTGNTSDSSTYSLLGVSDDHLNDHTLVSFHLERDLDSSMQIRQRGMLYFQRSVAGPGIWALKFQDDDAKEETERKVKVQFNLGLFQSFGKSIQEGLASMIQDAKNNGNPYQIQGYKAVMQVGRNKITFVFTEGRHARNKSLEKRFAGGGTKQVSWEASREKTLIDSSQTTIELNDFGVSQVASKALSKDEVMLPATTDAQKVFTEFMKIDSAYFAENPESTDSKTQWEDPEVLRRMLDAQPNAAGIKVDMDHPVVEIWDIPGKFGFQKKIPVVKVKDKTTFALMHDVNRPDVTVIQGAFTNQHDFDGFREAPHKINEARVGDPVPVLKAAKVKSLEDLEREGYVWLRDRPVYLMMLDGKKYSLIFLEKQNAAPESVGTSPEEDAVPKPLLKEVESEKVDDSEDQAAHRRRSVTEGSGESEKVADSEDQAAHRRRSASVAALPRHERMRNPRDVSALNVSYLEATFGGSSIPVLVWMITKEEFSKSTIARDYFVVECYHSG